MVLAGGVGYRVFLPSNILHKIPEIGELVKIFTYLHVKEDGLALYGFATPADRDFFRMMIENVTGVGPKMALTIMSRLSLPSLESAIRMGDIATLAKCPGIGKKTAERLVVELKSKVGGSDFTSAPSAASGSDAPAGASVHRDAVSALIALGYKAADADQAVRRSALVLGPQASTEALIKKSLSG